MRSLRVVASALSVAFAATLALGCDAKSSRDANGTVTGPEMTASDVAEGTTPGVAPSPASEPIAEQPAVVGAEGDDDPSDEGSSGSPSSNAPDPMEPSNPAAPSSTTIAPDVTVPVVDPADAGPPVVAPNVDSPAAADAGEPTVTLDAGTDVDAATSSAPLSVVTFNIRYDDGRSTSGQDAWNGSANPRRERVVALIEDMAPDLLGVQEALANQVDDLRTALPQYGFVGVGRDDGERAGEYAGVFYLEGRFELLDSGQFWLSETPETPGTVFEGSGSIRMATWIIVFDSAAQRELLLLNTHWDNVSQSSREASGALIHDRLETLAAGRPIVLTGDLNQNESNAAVQALTAPLSDGRALVNAYRSVHPEQQPDEATYHDFTGETRGEPIDFVLHTPELESLDALIRTDTFDGRYPSDHFPVLVEFRWGAAGALVR